jgi:hypothetical protein
MNFRGRFEDGADNVPSVGREMLDTDLLPPRHLDMYVHGLSWEQQDSYFRNLLECPGLNDQQRAGLEQVYGYYRLRAASMGALKQVAPELVTKVEQAEAKEKARAEARMAREEKAVAKALGGGKKRTNGGAPKRVKKSKSKSKARLTLAEEDAAGLLDEETLVG